ncbi:hypothetical protein PVL29_004503 [Vitis rotundifolia]|uniref:Peptidase A1 domain-containing protein n=1 Tax=Vitis rotundifolia TaxID=103349 RepID=A0AA39A878_VITRO|nr:hypothetical protein PVL29_004503 [Vitis rotundifolia]
MATPIPIIFLLKFLLYAALLLCNRGLAFQGREIALLSPTLHNVNITSLMPSSVCSPSPKGDDKRASLEVIHKHGPCSKLSQDKASSPSHTQMLDQDESRVNSLRSRLAKNPADQGNLNGSKATLPSKSGITIGTSNYVVTVGLGTPKRDLTLVFDTGSDLTWTQCQPCTCYKQQEPIFNPSMSTSYTSISCTSSTCPELQSANNHPPACSASSCVYSLLYGDKSYSVGVFAQDKLALTSTDVFNNFLFGCGQNNSGLFGSTAGLLGLGRSTLSIVSQTAQNYGKVFSYCLPSTSSSTGYLTFGSGGGTSKAVKYTPFLMNSKNPSFYFLNLIAISVGGNKLSTPASVFSTAGTFIDSGTVISRLPPTAYSDLRAAFQQQMSKYPKAAPASILDTCYNFSQYDTVDVPKINLYFSDGAEMDLDPSGILYFFSKSQGCLAFAGNNDANDIAILGNVQQKTFDVVYDVAGGRIGFAPGGCK